MSNKNDKNWMIQYESLVNFKKVHGHCHVQKSRSPWVGDGETSREQHKLALWVTRQRKAREKGTLKPERRQLLDDLDFYWNANDYGWDVQNYRVIKALSEEHGHADIPFSVKSINDSNRFYEPYMAWAKEQRIQYILRERNNHNQMSDWRIQKLQAIGFKWKSNDEEENKSLEGNAKTMNFRWIARKIPNYQWSDAFGAIREASEEHERTGKDTVAVMKDGNTPVLFFRLNDGTLVPKMIFDSEDVEAAEANCRNVVGFSKNMEE
jgi:hypothetical protein